MKNYIIVAAVSLIIGAIGTKFLFPTIQEKTVEVEKQVIQKDVVTEIREIIKKDGTKETITVTTDKSQEKKEASKVVAIAKSNWNIAVGALLNEDKQASYMIHVQRRILGNMHFGVVANTNKQAGVSISMEF